METEKPAKGKWSKVKDTDDLTFEIAKEKKTIRRSPEERETRFKQITRERSPQSLRPNKIRKKKTIALAFFLLVMSIVFYGIGFTKFQTEKLKEIWPIFLMATLLMIPGGYFTFVFVMILLGVDGYDYDMLPENDN